MNRILSLSILIGLSLLAACASQQNCARWEEKTAYRQKCMKYDGPRCVLWGTEPYTARYCADKGKASN